MFMGHYGPAVWDTQRGHGTPLVTLWQAFLAVQAMDIVFGILAILGLEGQNLSSDMPVFNIPYSHSLVSSIVIALICGGLFRMFKPSAGIKGFWVITALVFSHWVLDLIVHRPDLPLYPGSEIMMGLGVWNYPWPAYLLEMGLVFAGFWYWKRVTIARSMRYSIGLWSVFVFMAAIQAVIILKQGLDVEAGMFDPSSGPQGVMLGVSALLTYAVLAGLIAWIEQGRPSRFAPKTA